MYRKHSYAALAEEASQAAGATTTNHALFETKLPEQACGYVFVFPFNTPWSKDTFGWTHV